MEGEHLKTVPSRLVVHSFTVSSAKAPSKPDRHHEDRPPPGSAAANATLEFERSVNGAQASSASAANSSASV